ncbi:hypothetical protein Caci_1295 [Catenulispora acidiphila DSM 44928]|uniref:Uncharacterized protein n=1 Tax=Catenulispora acidiphila (strain DSM 44928 / JCM 14897 / NBRC 102108 / NRRL B-24433 / ID139908) TaxID=479433 RepID=C7Q7D2_CATAD|nr:WXG100 family type VII secretion target [Catenulispora acidiphila]ACU70220.1 hypothetical protein Caci_1295 [Catenulispora acidiphila DSM 44928]
MSGPAEAGTASGDGFGVGFAWAVEEPPRLDTMLTPVHRAAPSGLEGVLTSGVEWALREAGLLAVLERVSGDAEALHGAAVLWLEQAVAVRGISMRLRQDGAPVAGSWRGEAARTFGATMDTYLTALDRLALGMAATAHLLNRAGVAAGAAQDAVTGIVTDAAAWVAAELAATAVADVLTLGLASVGGALAGSATLAAFLARAERISAELAVLVEQLATELAELKAARDAIGAARGLSALRALRQAQHTVTELRNAGSVFRTAERATDAALGQAVGLPLDADGPRSLGAQIRRTIGDQAEEIESGR